MRTLEQERAFCEEGVHEEAEGITFETLGKELGQDTILFSPYLFWVIYFSHSMFLIEKYFSYHFTNSNMHITWFILDNIVGIISINQGSIFTRIALKTVNI